MDREQKRCRRIREISDFQLFRLGSSRRNGAPFILVGPTRVSRFSAKSETRLNGMNSVGPFGVIPIVTLKVVPMVGSLTVE